MGDSPGSRNSLLRVVGAMALFVALYLVARRDFVLFHTFAELFSVVVMFSIFTIAWNSRQLLDNNYLMFLGIACLFIGGVDTVHVLAYPGMGVFKASSTNLSAQIWLAARYVQGASFLLAPLFLRRRLNLTTVVLGYGAAVALLLLAIFSWGIFPTCFVEGVGLTPFKKGSEFLISAFFALSVLLLLRKREAFDPAVVRLLAASFLVAIPTELAFTGYRDPYGTANTIGHFLKIISFYLIYRAVVVTGIARPQQVLFRKLTQSEESLREGEERLRTLFETMSEGFSLNEIICDNTGRACDLRYLAVNPAFERHTGLKAADIVGRSCLELFPQAAPMWFEQYGRVALTGEPAHFEGSFGPLGRWFEVSAYRTEPGRFAVVFFDITARKRAEEEMRRLAQFPEENPNPVLRVAVEGKLLYANPPGRSMLAAMGATEESPLPQSVLTLMDQAAGQDRQVETEFADGHGRCWWVAAVRPVGEQHVNLYARDVTERKQAEELTQARLRMLVRANTPGVSLDETLQMLLDEIEAQTGSVISFYHFLESDQETLSLQNWSTNTLRSMCKAEGKGRHYAVSEAGVWVDCVRQRRPVVHNDYASLPNRKGLPPGHAPVVREMVVPIMRAGRIVAIIGMGNKPTDYGATDVDTVSHLGDFSWEIVQRKRAEEALRESQRDLNRAQAVAQTGSWRLDVRRDELVWSDENHRIFGIPKGTPMTYEAFLAIVHPEDREYVDRMWKAGLRGEPYDIEHRIVVDGQVRWVRERAELEFDEQGVLRGGFGTTQDVTERKQAAEALREAKERLELRVEERTAELNKSLESLRVQRQRFNDVLDMLPAYVVLLAPDYRVPFANRFFEGRFGTSEGRRCYEYLFQRTEPCENCESYKVLKTNAPHRWEWTGPDGRDYDISDFPFTDVDGSPLIMEVGLDITERKAAEKALRDSEQRYRALTEQSPTLVIIVQDEYVRYANPAAVEAIGYGLEELAARSPFDFVHPQGREQAREAFARVLGGETVGNVEIPILTKAGEVRWVQCSGTRIDLDGKPAVMVNGVDVTQQKHLEQQLIQSAKLTAIGELISGVAHELNNPLAGVLGCAQLAQELGAEGELADYLEKIVEQSRRASAIVGNLLVFARQREPEREPVSLNAVAIRALDLRRYELRVSNVQVVTELDAGLPYIQGDSQQLVQVLLNLINNADHAIRSRGDTGTITIRTSSFSRDGARWARLEVLDDGPGIPEAILGRIFEPFFTTKDPGEGTGLGLSVSYGIVTTHQGFIYADNRLEGGARFVLDLPVAEAREQATPVSGPRTPTAEPARILVIEDEQPVAIVLTRLLTGDGHKVTLAEEGAEAVVRLEAEPFDLVITDFKMPGMSGLDFYRLISTAHPELARRIIFTTGDVFSADTRRFFAEVGAPVLYKPFTLDQARSVIYGKLQEGET